jgi:hypothetical protein
MRSDTNYGLGRLAVLFALLFGALSSAGCAGKNFDLAAQPQLLTIGVTTARDITSRFGKPQTEARINKNGEDIRVITYSYSRGNVANEIAPARVASFYLNSGVLVGHGYRSSFKEDSTDFDSSITAGVVEGQTYCSEITEKIGQPSGILQFPVTDDFDTKRMVYEYSQLVVGVILPWDFGTSQFRIYAKSFSIDCDATGVVIDSTFAESGVRP